MEAVICKQAQPSANQGQGLPNLTGLPVHRGQSPLEGMTSPAAGRAKNQNTLSSAVYF